VKIVEFKVLPLELGFSCIFWQMKFGLTKYELFVIVVPVVPTAGGISRVQTWGAYDCYFIQRGRPTLASVVECVLVVPHTQSVEGGAHRIGSHGAHHPTEWPLSNNHVVYLVPILHWQG
jgi:hypothetical protein